MDFDKTMPLKKPLAPAKEKPKEKVEQPPQPDEPTVPLAKEQLAPKPAPTPPAPVAKEQPKEQPDRKSVV